MSQFSTYEMSPFAVTFKPYINVIICYKRFYFTSGCESLGLKVGQEPVGLGKLPSFLVSKKSEVICKFCGAGVSSLKEMVEHWKEERGREGLMNSMVGMEKVPHAEVVVVAREGKEVEKNFEAEKDQVSEKNPEEEMEMKEKLQSDKLHEMEMEIDPSQLLVEEARVEPSSEAGGEKLEMEVVEIGKAGDEHVAGEPDQELLEEVDLVTVLNELESDNFENGE